MGTLTPGEAEFCMHVYPLPIEEATMNALCCCAILLSHIAFYFLVLFLDLPPAAPAGAALSLTVPKLARRVPLLSSE